MDAIAESAQRPGYCQICAEHYRHLIHEMVGI